MATKDTMSSMTAGWLRPGQRFRTQDLSTPFGDQEVTVARIVQDPMGLTHAVLRDDSGREISAYADQIQFAIEVGMLSPLSFGTTGVAC